MNKKVIHTVFENIVAKMPDNIAIETSSNLITYAQFNAKANQIAHVLSELSKNREDIVCSFFEDKLTQLYALLGTFKAGKIYLPLDEKYKGNHWSVLYENICPKVVLTHEETIEKIESYNESFEYAIPQLVCITETNGKLGIKVYKLLDGKYEEAYTVTDGNTENLEINIQGDDANYIFFTSGSSGRPKAVLGNHKSLSHFVHWETKELQITENDRIGQLTSLSFDASLRDIFLPLMNGATICIPSEEIKKDVKKLKVWLKENKISILHTIPTMMRLLMQDKNFRSIDGNYFTELKYLLLAGEKLFNKDITEWRALFGDNTCIINLYGTTETTLIKTFYRVPKKLKGEATNGICVGKPISNCNILVLNEKNQICGIGEEGEVYIQTPFLTNGYYKEEQLNRQKFVPNPIGNFNDVIYKTGDYGKYDEDRNLIILGRKDGVIKLNGVRCDVNSIERNILELEAIKMLKCIPHIVEGTVQALVCFYSSEEQMTAAVKEHCMKFLSSYELLSLHFIHLKDFPVNSNGKVDTIELKEKVKQFFQKSDTIELPINETEQQLVSIWKEVLDIDRISVKDNIFLLGGNSIHLIQLTTRIHSVFGVELSIFDLFNLPVLKDQATKIATSNKSSHQKIPNAEVQENYPLSSAQYRIWVVSQDEESSKAYNTAKSIEVHDYLDAAILKNAILAVIERHEILRTIYKTNDNGEIRQWILPMESVDFKLDYVDYRGVEDAVEKIDRQIDENELRPFNLATGPLFRTTLYQISDNHFMLAYEMHHIICDGWSMGVFLRDLLTCYNAVKQGKEIELPELGIQYKDYACWDEAKFKDNSHDESLNFWKEELSGELPLLNLPTRKNRPSVKTHNGKQLRTYFSKEFSKEIKLFCNERETSLFIGLYTAFNILLHKYTRETDFIVGTPIAGRNHIDLENQIGVYVNTIPLRTKIQPEETIEDLFDRVKKNVLETYKHQEYPFDHLVEKLKIKTDISRSPVFDASFRLHNVGIQKSDDEITAEMIQEISDQGYVRTKADIDFSLEEIGDYIDFNVIYNTDIYEREMIEGFMVHFKELLKYIIENTDKTISEAEYITEAEKKKILVDFNDNDKDFSEKNILESFAQHVEATPNAIALIFEDKELTYEQLDKLSNQFANYLLSLNVTKEELIPICLERSVEMVVSVLGVLKSGGAYVPIDAAYPEERKNYTVKDSKARLVVTQKSLLDSFTLGANVSLIDIQEEAYKNHPTTAVDVDIQMDQLANVIYTSGTTGKPKGTMIEYKGIVNLIYNQVAVSDFQQGDRLLQFSSFAFDAFSSELYMAITTGSTLVMPTQEVIGHTDDLVALMNDKGVTLTLLPPSYKTLLKNYEFTTLKTIVSGGEALIAEEALHFIKKGIRIINAYGPTENMVNSTMTRGHFINSEKVSIGKTLANVKAYILDESLRICPIGVVGELCVAGIQVARGYLNRPELTDEKFVQNPFSDNPESKLYKTGDLCKWFPNGEIEYISRKDNQVKIRGNRVELGEVESWLQKHEDINMVVVTFKTNPVKELVAYVVSDKTLDVDELRYYLMKRVPTYMIPNYFVQIDKIPLNHNGKMDKSKLPEVTVENQASGKIVPPKTDEEKILIKLCKQILGVDTIGINNNFYNLGGDSIKLILLLSKLKKEGLFLKTKDALYSANFAEMASKMSNEMLQIDQQEVEGIVELLPIQEMFFNTLKINNKNHFNQSIVLASDKRLDKKALTHSIMRIVQHHDALRMKYYKNEQGQWEQYNDKYDEENIPIQFFDLTDSEDPIARMAHVGDEMQASINLEKGEIFKVIHFKLKDSDRIALIAHHLVVDGISWRIIVEDLKSAYYQYVDSKESSLPLKTHAFKHWTSQLKLYAEKLAETEEKDYWNNIAIQKIPSLLKKDSNTYTIIDNEVNFVLQKEYTELLNTRIHEVYNTQINDILLTALGITLNEVLEADTTLLRMEGHGREEIFDNVDISRTVGWFTTMFPFVLSTTTDKNVIENLIAVKKALRNIPNKGIGFGILDVYTNAIEKQVKPSVSFNYLGEFKDDDQDDSIAETENSEIKFSSEYIGSEIGEHIPEEVSLKVSGKIYSGQLEMSIQFSDEEFDVQTMQKFTETYKNTLKGIINNILNTTEEDVYKNSEEFSIRNEYLYKTYKVSSNQNSMLKMKEKIGINEFYISEYDENIFNQKFRKFLSHYPFLCVKIIKEHGVVVQEHISHEEVKVAVQKYDLSITERNEVEKKMEAFFMKPFEVFSEELIRVFVITDKENRKGALVNVGIHHGITDAYTNDFLMNMMQRYFNGQEIETSQFSNFEFAVEQENFIASVEGKSQRKYWTGLYENLLLETENLHDELYTRNFVKQTLTIHGEEFDYLKKIALDIKVPINSLLMALHQHLIAKFNSGAVVQNIVSNGREQSTEEHVTMLGVMSNMLPVPLVDKKVKNAFNSSYVKLIYEKYINVRLHQEIPFEIIKEDVYNSRKIDIEKIAGGNFNYLVAGEKISQGKELEVNSLNREDTVGIHMYCVEYSNGIEINLTCSESLYQEKQEFLNLNTIINNNLLIKREIN
jgi:amino acid adenylation domain-containing protein/non-ribosomal peptide synthase protein (TIGR01720 family)